MRRAIRLVIAALIVLTAGSCFLADNALHVWDHSIVKGSWADTIAHQTGSSWQPSQVTADDGARLEAWLFTPRQPNGAAVILMHGVGDTRMGMTGHAPFLLRAGYTVLLPDSRGHGTSGGGIITYGVREAGDIHRWADALLRQPGITRLYGLGQSLGAAILLESLPREPRFRALVADCSFVTFEEIAFDRLAQHGLASYAAAWPVINLGFVYARARYGINLWHASPAEALRATRTPVLLIHGAGDDNIPPRHSRQLHAANPATTELWEVPKAGHVASLVTQPEAYERRVVAWFDTHR
jgi:dipeptidyl aminopeptidase/acylaminoacyl peptidase